MRGLEVRSIMQTHGPTMKSLKTVCCNSTMMDYQNEDLTLFDDTNSSERNPVQGLVKT